MRQLLPHHVDPVAVDDVYGRGIARPQPTGRPWVAVSMIASVDGATALDGLSGGLGGPGDKAVFAAMRRAADVVIAGAATVRDEGYRPPARRELRIAVVTASGNVDVGSELFTSGAGLVITTERAPALPVPMIRAGVDQVDLAAALAQLDAGLVVCEGGPKLNAAMHEADLVDELCITVAPMLVGGPSARIVNGHTSIARRLDLAHLLSDDDGYLYLRYARTGSTS